MGLSGTVSEINGDFSLKSQIFTNPVYFAPSPKGLPLNLGTGAQDEQEVQLMLTNLRDTLSG